MGKNHFNFISVWSEIMSLKSDQLELGFSICKGPKYRFSLPIDFKSCREEIAGALQKFCNGWCERKHVESNALNSWKLNIF